MTSLATIIGMVPMALKAWHRQRTIRAPRTRDHWRVDGVNDPDGVHRSSGAFDRVPAESESNRLKREV
jgi:hypothetical protein